MLHFQQHQTSPPSLHISANDGQSATRSSLTALRSFHGNLAAPYLDRNDGFNFAVQDQNLRSAILYGSQEQITDLLSSGISVNTRDPFGNTPLHTAILRGDVAIVKSLFRYGADVDAIGFKGKTPLHLGAASKEMLKLILKHSPTLSLQDDEGNTVLHYMLSIRDW
jgi:ankyrin repeat protein